MLTIGNKITKNIQTVFFTVFALMVLPKISFAQRQIVEVRCQDNVQNCDLDALLGTFNNILVVLIQISIGILVIVLAWGGWKYLTAGGNAAQVTEGTKAIRTAVFGFITVLLAYLIIELIFTTLGSEFTPFRSRS